MDIFAREEIAVCEDAGMFKLDEPPVIVAHSFGGFVTMLTGGALWRPAGRRGDRRFAGQSAGPARRAAATRDQAAQRLSDAGAAMARFRLMPPQTCDNLYIVDWVARHSLKEVPRTGQTASPGSSIRPSGSDFSIGDTAERLRATRCRIAVFRGEHSVLLPPEIGEYMFNLLGRAAPVVEIPQAQHHIMLDQPLALVAALRALLADWEHSTATRKPA